MMEEFHLELQEQYYKKLLTQIQDAIKTNERYQMYSKEWLEMAPNAPGIYFVLHNDDIVYVGESANLNKRMRDLRSTYNHTLRRKLGKALFTNHEHYSISSSSKKYHPVVEEKITSYALDKLKVIYIELKIGRKEMESAFLTNGNLPIYNSHSIR